MALELDVRTMLRHTALELSAEWKVGGGELTVTSGLLSCVSQYRISTLQSRERTGFTVLSGALVKVEPLSQESGLSRRKEPPPVSQTCWGNLGSARNNRTG